MLYLFVYMSTMLPTPHPTPNNGFRLVVYDKCMIINMYSTILRYITDNICYTYLYI